MKTILQALIDEVYYPIPSGMVENILIRRGLSVDDNFNNDVACSDEFVGATADCLISLVQAISFSEADKSVTALSYQEKNMLITRANKLYKQIGETEVDLGVKPKVYIGG